MIDCYPREFIEAAVTCTGPTQNQQSTFQHGGGRGPELPHTTEELLAVDGFWGGEKDNFLKEWPNTQESMGITLELVDY